MQRQAANKEIMQQKAIASAYIRKNRQRSYRRMKNQTAEGLLQSPQLIDDHIGENIMRVVQSSHLLPPKKIITKKISEFSIEIVHAFMEKEALQREIATLKSINNTLLTENSKLKTNNRHLERQILKYQKLPQEKPEKSEEIHQSLVFSLKVIIKNLKNEVQRLKMQETKLKKSVRCTKISEFQVQRSAIQEQSRRLRELLQLQIRQNKRQQSQMQKLKQDSKKIKQPNHHSQAQQQLQAINQSQINIQVQHQKTKPKTAEKRQHSIPNKVKWDDDQIQRLKDQLSKVKSQLQAKDIQITKSKLQTQKVSKIKSQNEKKLRQLEAAAKRPNNNKKVEDKCTSCQRLKQSQGQLETTITDLKSDISKLKSELTQAGNANQQLKISMANLQSEISRLRTELNKAIYVEPPQMEDMDKVKRFLVLCFKAHQLSLHDVLPYLISQKYSNQNEQISIEELMEVIMAGPFNLITDKYIQTFIYTLCHQGERNQPMTIDKNQKISKQKIRHNFTDFIGNYELMAKSEEDKLFIEISTFLTTNRNIFKLLKDKEKANEGLSESDFRMFFGEIMQDPRCIEYMLTQIILSSQDLDHLSVEQLFQIFFISSDIQHKEEQIRILPSDAPIQEAEEENQQSNIASNNRINCNSQDETNNAVSLPPPSVNSQQHSNQQGQREAHQMVAVEQLPVGSIEAQNIEDEYADDYQIE